MAFATQDLLLHAQKNAAPYTRRIARQLAFFAGAALTLSLLTALWPHLAQAISALALGAGFVVDWAWPAVSFVTKALWAVGVGVAKGLWFMFSSLKGGYGIAIAFASLVVLNAWYRARRYVMQAAVELALNADISEADGKTLMEQFFSTHARVSGAMTAIAIFAMAQLTLTSMLAIEQTAVVGGSPDIGTVVGWFLMLVLTFFFAISQYELTDTQLEAYALFRGCGLPSREFLRAIAERSTEPLNAVNTTLARLQARGLARHSHQAVSRAVHEATILAKRSLQVATAER